jgi:FtsH-binding integral membrane protein
MRPTDAARPYSGVDVLNPFLRAVYGWMAAGLGITAITSWLVASAPSLVFAVAANRLLFWAVIIAQLGIVFTLSARVARLAPATAAILFVAYAALTGLTLSVVLLTFTGESIAATFVVTAGMFGSVALYGTTTGRSLEGLGQFLFMGLIGVVLASIVAIFWHNDAFQFVLSFIGVVVFTGLAAYDVPLPASIHGQSPRVRSVHEA